jgi:EAL domain-containing protein (putative c-di-GMP-specific phosphodiesterase class I)
MAAGCTEAQGHYFSRALSEAEVQRMLTERVASASKARLAS